MTRRSRPRTAGSILAAVAAALVLVPSGAATGAPAAALDIDSRATTWDRAAALLGTAGSLWDPVRTSGLSRSGDISVLAGGLSFANGASATGDTYAGARYGKGRKAFSISQKWARTGWAAEPAFTTSMAEVGTVRIPIGLPGTTTRVRAVVYANCFAQPAAASPRPIPAGFRCAKSDVLAYGGVLMMTARPASTATSPGNTSIVIQTSGLTYGQLVFIASGLEQVAGAPAEGAGSAQMVGMCRQMVASALTFNQAAAFAAPYGYIARVGSIDGVPQAVTADFRPDRFTLSMVSNAVVSCTYG